MMKVDLETRKENQCENESDTQENVNILEDTVEEIQLGNIENKEESDVLQNTDENQLEIAVKEDLPEENTAGAENQLESVCNEIALPPGILFEAEARANESDVSKPTFKKMELRSQEDEWDWLKYFYNSKPRLAILTDDNLVAESESEGRIFILFLVLTFILSIGIISLLMLLSQPKHHNLVVVMPNAMIKEDNYAREFPLLHIAVVLQNGTVLDVSMFENVSPSKNVLFKLPTPNKHQELLQFYSPYHGYSDAKGVLYFIDGQTRRLVTKYHPMLDNAGHVTLPKSQRPNNCLTYHGSLMISSQFWLYSSSRMLCGHFPADGHVLLPWTAVWHTKRQVWSDGPQMPDFNFVLDDYNWIFNADDATCTATLNESHAIFAALKSNVGNENSIFVLDFKQNRWSLWPSMPLKSAENGLMFVGCRGTLSYSSKGKRYIIIHLQEKQYPASGLRHTVLSYDLSKEAAGQWTVINQFWMNSEARIVYFMDIKGTLNSFFENGMVLKHSKHGILEEYNMLTLSDQGSDKTIFGLVPYLV